VFAGATGATREERARDGNAAAMDYLRDLGYDL